MNTALLSARKRTPSGDLRAHLALSGRSVLGWQVALAQKLGCTRIICLCDAPTPEILAIQRNIESSGGEFHAVRSSLQLASLLRSHDRLLMLLDGVVIEPDFAKELVADDDNLKRAVLTLEAGTAQAERHPSDFERIDATRCWAGMAVMPAELAQKLTDLPADGDAVSMLLRLALQSRTAMVPVQLHEPSDNRWVLASEARDLSDREDALIKRATPAADWGGPLGAIAGRLVRFGAPRGLENGTMIGAGGALILSLSAIVLMALGHSGAGLSLAAIGAFSGRFGSITSIMKSAILEDSHNSAIDRYLNVFVDCVAIISLSLAVPREPLILIAVPVLTIGLTKLAAKASGTFAAPFWNDRALHLAGFAICAVYGRVLEGLLVLGLLALAQCFGWGRPANNKGA